MLSVTYDDVAFFSLYRNCWHQEALLQWSCRGCRCVANTLFPLGHLQNHGLDASYHLCWMVNYVYSCNFEMCKENINPKPYQNRWQVYVVHSQKIWETVTYRLSSKDDRTQTGMLLLMHKFNKSPSEKRHSRLKKILIGTVFV